MDKVSNFGFKQLHLNNLTGLGWLKHWFHLKDWVLYEYENPDSKKAHNIYELKNIGDLIKMDKTDILMVISITN